MEQLTKNQAVATSQEAVQNQNEPQLRDENAHNDKSVHGVLNPTYQAGLRRDAVQPDIEAERKKRDEIEAGKSYCSRRFGGATCDDKSAQIKFNLTIPLQQLNGLETLVIIMVANKYAFLQITRRRFLNEWEAFKKVISRRNIRRRITIPLTLSNLKLLRRITRTENILHRNFTRRQVAIQNRVASNIGISQSTFSVKVLNLFSRSRRKTNKRKSKHSAMLRNKETRHRMFIGLLNTTRKLA